MYCLSLETSGKRFAIALSKQGQLLRFRNIPSMPMLEKSILVQIDRVLATAKIDLKDLGVLGIGLGPGSFTSLRVGLATVKALAHVGGQKVVGVCTLDIIAQALIGSACDEICVITDARRQLVYWALYTPQGVLKSAYGLSSIDEVLTSTKGKTLFVGDAIKIYKDKIKASKPQAVLANEHLWFAQAKSLDAIVNERIKHKRFDDPMQLVPIYLYAQDCQVTPKS